MDEDAGYTSPSDVTQRLLADAIEGHEAFNAAVERLQHAAGVPQHLLDALERAHLPFLEDRYWRRDVIKTPSQATLMRP